jgi:zinc protease
VTAAALKEFITEFNRLLKAGDVTDAEVAKARNTVRTETVERFATLGATVGAAAGLLEDNLPWESIAADLAAAEGVSARELNALAASGIALNKGVLVLVGDRAQIREQMAAVPELAPWLAAMKDVDAEGNPKATAAQQ